MKRYTFNNRGYYTGEIELTEFDTFPANSTTIAPPLIPAGKYARFKGDTWEILESLPARNQTIPASASKAKIKIALKRAGKLPALISHIKSLGPDSEERILLEDEHIIKRGETISSLIQGGLGLSEEEMDNLFTVANEIG